jgi:hypothetical protein
LRWLVRRPLKPLGLIRLEEVNGRLTHIVFDPQKGPIHSGTPDLIFGTVVGGLAGAKAMAEKMGEQFTARLAESECFGDVGDWLRQSIGQHAGLSERLNRHPLAEVYRNPERAREFLDEGKVYTQAMKERREIYEAFASPMKMRDVFIQTEPPTFESQGSRIDDVMMTTTNHCIVYLKPTFSTRPSAGGSPHVCYAQDPGDEQERQLRFHVVFSNAGFAIHGCEVRYGDDRFHKLVI